MRDDDGHERRLDRGHGPDGEQTVRLEAAGRDIDVEHLRE
jgi:hypothetical protein